MHATVDFGPFAGFDRGDCDRSRGYAPGILKRDSSRFFSIRVSRCDTADAFLFLALRWEGKDDGNF